MPVLSMGHGLAGILETLSSRGCCDELRAWANATKKSEDRRATLAQMQQAEGPRGSRKDPAPTLLLRAAGVTQQPTHHNY